MIDHKYLFQSMPVPRFLVSRDDDGRFFITEMNEKARTYFDLGNGSSTNLALDKIMDNENAQHFIHSFDICFKNQVPVTIKALPNLPGAMQVNAFWVNPLLDNEGDISILDVMGQPDLADHSTLQRERDDAISLLTSIFDASEVGIVVTDRKRQIVRLNDSFIRTYGWTRDELIGEDFVNILTEDERIMAIDNHQELLESGARSSGETKVRRSDGSVANVLFTTSTLELSHKRRFQVTTVMDITLRKQMEISLREAKEEADSANRSKSSFLANMSHELRTPLNAIIGFSEIMQNETFGLLGNEKYKEYLGDIHLSARHLLEIINEVLDMSKIEAGRLELYEEKINVEELIEAVTRIMTSRAFSASLDIKIDIEKDVPHLYADPRLIRQVMINLLTNAIKYSEQGGRIDIKAYSKDRNLIFEIIDEGVGIPSDQLDEAMQPFGQVKRGEHTADNQGTGLGLPLAKAMVELHKGRLLLESEYNKGTKAIIKFPASRLIPSVNMDSADAPEDSGKVKTFRKNEDAKKEKSTGASHV